MVLGRHLASCNSGLLFSYRRVRQEDLFPYSCSLLSQYLKPSTSTGSCAMNECELASDLVSNLNGYSINCCTLGCSSSLCDISGFPNWDTFISAQFGIPATIYGVLSETQIRQALSNNQPIIMCMQGSTSGHALMLYGYSSSTGLYYVSDRKSVSCLFTV
jgi:hypothetical protein